MLAWPTVPAVAPPLEAPLVELPSGTLTADQANVRGGGLANLTGIPAISVPVGCSATGCRSACSCRPPGGATSCCSTPPRRWSAPTAAAGSRRCRRCARAEPSSGRRCLIAAGRGRDGRARPAPELARGRARRHRFAYTRPSPGRYPWQWYWDSCFAAIVWRRFEPARARAELREPARGAARRTASSATRSSGTGRSRSAALPFYNVTSRRAVPDRDDPAAAAGLGLADRRRRPGARSRGSPPRSSGSRANRDLEGDGLLWIIQPDESGLDASPKFDPVWGRRANARLGFPLLVRRNRRLGFDARRIRERGGPCSARSLVNTLWSLSLQALGRPSATPALVERLWDERRGLFLDEAAARAERGPRSSPGPRWRRSPCPTCRRRSAGAWSRSTCSTRASSSPRSRRPRSPLASRATSRAAAAARSAATGAGRPGSTRPGWSGSACAGSATRRRRAQLAGGVIGAVEREGPARVLRPAHRRWARRRGLRLVGPGRRAGRSEQRTAVKTKPGKDAGSREMSGAHWRA